MGGVVVGKKGDEQGEMYWSRGGLTVAGRFDGGIRNRDG